MFDKIKKAGNWPLFFRLVRPKSVEEVFSIIMILVLSIAGIWWSYAYGFKGDFSVMALFEDPNKGPAYQTHPADSLYRFDPNISPIIIALDGTFLNVNLADEAKRRNWKEGQPVLLKISKNSMIGAKDTSRAAIRVGSFPEGSSIGIINHGRIIGSGGAGGVGADAQYPRFASGSKGQDGGTALETQIAISLLNTGTIAGGGGGGGGGGASWVEAVDVNNQSTRYLFSGGGGGGGQGSGTILGGDAGATIEASRGPSASNLEKHEASHGEEGNLSRPGAGGRKNLDMPLYAGAGSGGSGGAFGQPGSKGESASKGGVVNPKRGTPGSARGAYGGDGGKAGFAIRGNAYVTTISQGTLLGPTE